MIPIVTQPCFDSNLVPIGVVMASVAYQDTFKKRFDSLLAELRKAAPSDCTALYNFRFIDGDSLRGFADAFRKPAGKSC